MSAHREIQPEKIAVDNVDVASFGSSEGVNTPVEGFIRAYLNGDTRVFAVNRHCNSDRSSREVSHPPPPPAPRDVLLRTVICFN